jgi:hypothetical protein
MQGVRGGEPVPALAHQEQLTPGAKLAAIQGVRGAHARSAGGQASARTGQGARRGDGRVDTRRAQQPDRGQGLSEGARGVGTPRGAPVQFEEHIIDAELGRGGENKLQSAAILRCNLTLACSYDDFKVAFTENIVNMYPGLCKALLCKLRFSREREKRRGARHVTVFFGAAALSDVKLSHDLTKPTAFSQLVEDKVVAAVEAFATEVPTDVIGYGSSKIQKEKPPPKVSRFEWVPEVEVALKRQQGGG